MLTGKIYLTKEQQEDIVLTTQDILDIIDLANKHYPKTIPIKEWQKQKLPQIIKDKINE